MIYVILYFEYKNELFSLGFEYNNIRENINDLTKKMLLRYKAIYKNTNVPKSFVIPSTIDWPTEWWGGKLGILKEKVQDNKEFDFLIDDNDDEIDFY